MKRRTKQPEPATSYANRLRQEKRERIEALLETIKTNRPYWASLPPWQAERFLERGEQPQEQTELFPAP